MAATFGQFPASFRFSGALVMKSIYTLIAHYSTENECYMTDTVLSSLSEVCDGTVSLRLCPA